MILHMYICLFFLKDQPDWSEILQYFRGSELQNYFTKVLEDDLKVSNYFTMCSYYSRLF